MHITCNQLEGLLFHKKKVEVHILRYQMVVDESQSSFKDRQQNCIFCGTICNTQECCELLILYSYRMCSIQICH